MRITLVINRLVGGGAERNLIALANFWSRQGRAITIVAFSSVDPAYPVDSGVRIVHLGQETEGASNLFGTLWRNVRRWLLLRRALLDSQPDVIVPFNAMPSIMSILAVLGSQLPVIASERVDPSMHSISPAWTMLRPIVYRRARLITMLSAGGRETLPQSVQDRIRVIPNPVVFDTQPRDVDHKKNNKIVGMGRLVYQKGFDLLILAFALAHQAFPDWTLEIIGEGSDREDLLSLAKACQIDHLVNLTGWISSPYERLQGAEIFVFSSRYEGFGMALAEAMACGVASISFDCPSGPRELIRDGYDGILVPPENIEALAAEMRKLMRDPALRAQLGEHATEITQRFTRERTMSLWENALAEAIGAEKYAQIEEVEKNARIHID